MNIIVMGPQGSGKSTQAELLAREFKLPHLQTGELYRCISEQNSLLARRIKKILGKGELISEKDHREILGKEIKKPKYGKGFVLDGSPRTLNQAKIQPFKVDEVFYLEVSDEVNTKRLLKRGRKDDVPELIKKRLEIYHRQTEPVLDHYRQMGVLEEVDGERPIEEIHQDIMERMRQ